MCSTSTSGEYDMIKKIITDDLIDENSGIESEHDHDLLLIAQNQPNI